MNSLIANNSISMSSLDISNLVGSRHDKVKQSIERLAERKVIAQPPMGSVLEYGSNVIQLPPMVKVKNHLEQYSFIEGQDFTPVLGKSSVGRATVTHYVD